MPSDRTSRGEETDAPWQRERYQRDCIGRAWCVHGDLVIISDADEIVRREAILTAEKFKEFCFLRMHRLVRPFLVAPNPRVA
jgi:hypothetical protein